MLFSKQLMTIRNKCGYTQQALTDKIGIHVTPIKRYEAGAAQLTLEVFRNIVLALNVSADAMFCCSNPVNGDRMMNLGCTLKRFSSWTRKKKTAIKELI